MTLVEGKDYIYPRGVDGAKVIQVIETRAARGSGQSEESRSRLVRQYWSFDGELLAEHDPLYDGNPGHIFPPFPAKVQE